MKTKMKTEIKSLIRKFYQSLSFIKKFGNVAKTNLNANEATIL